jgi:uncharacterized protein YaaQ
MMPDQKMSNAPGIAFFACSGFGFLQSGMMILLSFSSDMGKISVVLEIILESCALREKVVSSNMKSNVEGLDHEQQNSRESLPDISQTYAKEHS